MKKAEFVKRWVDMVQAGRRRNFPDISPAENAASTWEDMKVGEKYWRKYRIWLMSPEEQERIFAPKQV